jgi:hypothetical protein
VALNKLLRPLLLQRNKEDRCSHKPFQHTLTKEDRRVPCPSNTHCSLTVTLTVTLTLTLTQPFDRCVLQQLTQPRPTGAQQRPPLQPLQPLQPLGGTQGGAAAALCCASGAGPSPGERHSDYTITHSQSGAGPALQEGSGAEATGGEEEEAAAAQGAEAASEPAAGSGAGGAESRPAIGRKVMGLV